MDIKLAGEEERTLDRISTKKCLIIQLPRRNRVILSIKVKSSGVCSN